jgi:hypothetical protein
VQLALAALLAGLLLAALLSALTARFLLLLTGFLLGILLTALLTTLAALAALLAALIWIVGHRKRLLIAGRPRKFTMSQGHVGSENADGTRARFETNVSQEPMRSREYK